MAKKKKQKHLLGKKEFLFNFFSLVTLIVIGLYFGGRSLYYYSKQNMSNKGGNQVLKDVVINNNKLVKDVDGFHRDSDGYYFKGNVKNNYVSFANRVYRILRINSDGSIKLVSEDNASSFMWGEADSYNDSNIHNWLDKTSIEHSGVYYDTIPDVEKFLVKTSYNENTLDEDKVVESKEKYDSFVSTLTIKDYIDANGMNSYLNNGGIYYLLGMNTDKEKLYVEEDGSIQGCDGLSSYGIRPVITLKSTIKTSSGDGTSKNPYVIFQGKSFNYIGKYVKLGNEIWKVYGDKDGILRLHSDKYAIFNNKELKFHWSTESNAFDLEDIYNLGYFLNNRYLESLSYSKFLVENDYYTGELSVEEGYNYSNVYKNKVRCKVGGLNIFDYRDLNQTDFYYINTLAGEMKYIALAKDMMEEVDMTELRHVVPTVSIKSESIKKGNGTQEDPYIVG